jgi:hypothetical protein
MANISRFYQIGGATLLEYEFNNTYSVQNSGEWGAKNISNYQPFVFNLFDGSKMLVDTSIGGDLPSNNIIQNIAIPYNSTKSSLFRITNNDIDYTDYTDAMCKFGSTDCGVIFDTNTESYPFDKIKLYFTSGYFLNDIAALDVNISVISDKSVKITLAHLYFDKESVLDYEFLERPLIVGNRIYDKIITLRVPSIKYFTAPANKDKVSIVPDAPYTDTMYRRMSENSVGHETNLPSYLDISAATTVKIEYTAIMKDNIIVYSSVDDNTYDVVGAIRNLPVLSNDAILYTNNNVTICTLPQYANSDGITAGMSVKEGYVEFGGYWQGVAITKDILNKFNTDFPLYDISLKNNANLYDADADNNDEWIAYHEIVAYFYDDTDNEIIDDREITPAYKQVISFIQKYEINDDGVLLYKPVIKKDYNITHVEFVYNYRLINVRDDVQFLRTASAAYDGNISDFFSNTVRIRLVDASGITLEPTNSIVYNKIYNVEQKIGAPSVLPMSTNYTKVFYDVSDIVLDNNGEYIQNNTYTLNLSNASKNYKFKFRKYDSDGVLTIYDLSDYTFKLYSRDANGGDIMIEPTYSENMNQVLGEIEFNINTSNILKLKNVDTTARFMSIIVVNTDGSTYSMFDFTYQ